MNRLTNNISDQLFFQRYGNGIKLVKPKRSRSITSLTVADILRTPANIYFSNADGVTEKCNEICASSCGYDSVNDALGKTPLDTPNTDIQSSYLCLRNNNMVMSNNRLTCMEENFYRIDKSGFHALSFKLPWYDSDDKTIGIFGCSIVIGSQPLAQTLSILMQIGLLKSAHDFTDSMPAMGRQLGDVYFSKREFECLSLAARSKSAREIATMLGVSTRTVEQYLANTKLKMKVKTKSELIEKVRCWIQ